MSRRDFLHLYEKCWIFLLANHIFKFVNTFQKFIIQYTCISYMHASSRLSFQSTSKPGYAHQPAFLLNIFINPPSYSNNKRIIKRLSVDCIPLKSIHFCPEWKVFSETLLLDRSVPSILTSAKQQRMHKVIVHGENRVNNYDVSKHSQEQKPGWN